MNANEKKVDVKKILSIVGNVLVWAFVILSLVITAMVFGAQKSEDGVPSLFGKSFITIESPSMTGTYNMGDMVIMTKLTREEKLNLKEGQIITFRTSIDIDNDGKPGDLNTHRIHEGRGDTLSFVTKGDHNPYPDNVGDNPYEVHVDDIIGVCEEDDVFRGLGNVIKFLSSSLGFFLCIVLPLILFFLYELYNFITVLMSERKKLASANAAETEEEIKRRAIEEFLAAQAAEKAKAEAEEEIKRRAVEEYLAAQAAKEPEAQAETPESTEADN